MGTDVPNIHTDNRRTFAYHHYYENKEHLNLLALQYLLPAMTLNALAVLKIIAEKCIDTQP